MLTIKTKLKEVPGKGIGLISDQEIKKGQTVWIYNPIIDITVKKKDVTKEVKDFFDIYSCDLGGDIYMLNVDDARFINHSKNPNIKNLGSYDKSIALKNIKKGEEITIDYNTIDVTDINFEVI